MDKQREMQAEIDGLKSRLSRAQKVNRLLHERVESLEHVVSVSAKRNPVLIRQLCIEPYFIAGTRLILRHQYPYDGHLKGDPKEKGVGKSCSGV